VRFYETNAARARERERERARGVFGARVRAWSVTARRLSAVPGQILTLITIATCFVYPTVWVLGEEGLQAFDINVETGVIVMADLMAKVSSLSLMPKP
jgi:bacteriorhodopsin